MTKWFFYLNLSAVCFLGCSPSDESYSKEILGYRSANNKVALCEDMVASFDTATVNHLFSLPATSPRSRDEEVRHFYEQYQDRLDSKPYSGLTFECKGQILVHSFHIYCRELLSQSDEGLTQNQEKAADCVEKMLQECPTEWDKRTPLTLHFNLLRLIEVGMRELETGVAAEEIGTRSVLEIELRAGTGLGTLQKLLKNAILEKEKDLLDFIIEGTESSRHLRYGAVWKGFNWSEEYEIAQSHWGSNSLEESYRFVGEAIDVMSASNVERLCSLTVTELDEGNRFASRGARGSRVLRFGNAMHPVILDCLLEILESESLDNYKSIDRFFAVVGTLESHFHLLSESQNNVVTNRLLFVMRLGWKYDPYRIMPGRAKPNRFKAASYLCVLAALDSPGSITRDLMSAPEENRLRTISTDYPFYISLGKPGTEEVLVSALDMYFNKQMAIDLLNCGSAAVEDGAKEVCIKKGFKVYLGEGDHKGPRWGEGV